MTFTSYIGALDLTLLPAPLCRRLARDVVPRIIGPLERDGIDVTVGHDLTALQPVMALHPERPRLFEIANPVFQPSASARDTIVLLMHRGQEPVACAACRVKWVEGSVAEALQDRTALYDEPLPLGEEGQVFRVKTRSAHAIEGCFVLWTTAVVVLPGNPGVFKAVIRLLHLKALGEHPWSHAVALASDRIASRYSLDVEGYAAVEPGVAWKRDGVWTPYRFVHAPRRWVRELVVAPEFADLRKPLGAPVLEDDA